MFFQLFIYTLLFHFSSSQIYSWGRNEFGQLGDGTNNNNKNVPVMIQQLSNNVIQISCGEQHSLALLGKKKEKYEF